MTDQHARWVEMLAKSEGWQLMQREMEDSLKATRQQLEQCSPDELAGLQARARVLREFMTWPEEQLKEQMTNG